MSDASRLEMMLRVQRAALRLFEKYGYAETTVSDIAQIVGISPRTVFRYFETKADLLWGDVEPVLQAMDEYLGGVSDDVPILHALAEAHIACNAIHKEGITAHRQRMHLIHSTPALQAQRSLRSAEEREVIARFAARRLGEPATALAPQAIGHLALALMVASYDAWLADQRADLAEIVRSAFAVVSVQTAAVRPY